MNGFDYMEVDLPEVEFGIDNKSIPSLPSLTSLSEGSSPGLRNISFFKHEPQEAIAAPQPLARQQQTHEPTCPELGAGNFEAFDPPSTDGFEYIGLSPQQFLPADDVDRYLAEIKKPDGDASVPAVPLVFEPPAAAPMHLICIVPRQQCQQASPSRRQRRDTISLLPQEVERSSERDEHSRDVIHELMDDADDDRGSEHFDHTPEPRLAASTSEMRVFAQLAHSIMELHHDGPHAKKKPMLHEYLGYILLSPAPSLDPLRSCVFFCRENGDRLAPGKVAGARYFRVSNFETIAEVWRLVKNNFSQDCMKNMKRAMRMSTKNARGYFESLTQRAHRQQIFRFGDRSVEHFRKVFPPYVAG